MKIERQRPQVIPNNPAKSFLRQPITLADLRAFDLPLPNGQMPDLLPWNNRAEFCSAMFFNFDEARNLYLMMLVMNMIPPTWSLH